VLAFIRTYFRVLLTSGLDTFQTIVTLQLYSVFYVNLMYCCNDGISVVFSYILERHFLVSLGLLI